MATKVVTKEGMGCMQNEKKGTATIYYYFPINENSIEWWIGKSLRRSSIDSINIRSRSVAIYISLPIEPFLQQAGWFGVWGGKQKQQQQQQQHEREREVKVLWARLRRGCNGILFYLLNSNWMNEWNVEKTMGEGMKRKWA